jgi:hypothetical protein
VVRIGLGISADALAGEPARRTVAKAERVGGKQDPVREGLLALVIGMKAITPPQHAASLTPDKVLVSVRRDMRWWIFDVLERVRRSGGE